MATREFTDSQGIAWRVWDVTPDVMHPVTRSEDFMAKLHDGWLAFESAADKRRLPAPYPVDWATYGVKQLEELSRRATPVGRRPTTPVGEERAKITSEIERAAMDRSGGVRTFSSPRGRMWTVREHERVNRRGETTTVLRFTNGDLIVELSEWPNNWRWATVEQYALMLLDGDPPLRYVGPEQPARRWDDRRV